MSGPLSGIRIIEMAGIGPAPFACMLLSDLGADVIRVDRPGKGGAANPADFTSRGRQSIAVDLKHAAGVEVVLKLVESADVIIEGFRPGGMEKLGLGPEICLSRNRGIVYGRMTGWGQDGPLSHAAGHDLNYIAITGALAAIGRQGTGPVPPLNLLGDYAGGAMYLLLGVLSALLERSRSGEGQVVDAAICDGVVSLMTAIHAFKAMGMWQNEPQSNLLDGGAHFYDTYRCADGKYVSIGSIESPFYSLLAEKLDLDLGDPGAHFDRSLWPVMKARIAERIQTKSRDEWCELLEGSDVCFAPVLDMEEAPNYPHNHARGNFVEEGGFLQPAPAPRFSRTPSSIQGPPAGIAEAADAVLASLGYSPDEVAELKACGAVAELKACGAVAALQ